MTFPDDRGGREAATPRRRRSFHGPPIASRAVAVVVALVVIAHGATGYQISRVAPVLTPTRARPSASSKRTCGVARPPTAKDVHHNRRTRLLAATGGLTPNILRQRVTARELEVRRAEAELAELRSLLLRERQELKQLLKQQPGGGAAPTFRETTARSLVKAIGWRIVAGLITFASSFYFTHKLWTSLAIVGSDFLSKVFTMFIGERLFNRVKAGRSASGDNVGRSVVKALIWRAIAFVNTATISGLMTSSAGIGAQIASFDAIVKTALMVGYDQAWNRVDWGKELENVDGDGI